MARPRRDRDHIQRTSGARRPGSVRARLPVGTGGHRVKTARFAVEERTVKDVAQVEKHAVEAVRREAEEDWG